jgi:hypothetical protein
VQTALKSAIGVEGGFWQADAGPLAYAFSTYEGTGDAAELSKRLLTRGFIVVPRGLKYR